MNSLNVRRSPFHLVSRDQFFGPIEQIFDEVVNGLMGSDFKSLKSSGYPRMDVLDDGERFIVEVAVSGVNPEDIRVEVEPAKVVGDHPYAENDILHISGRMSNVRSHAQYHIRELSRKAFRRSMYLPTYIRGDPEAVFKNGLLTLSWKLEQPVRKEPNNRLISIKTEVD